MTYSPSLHETVLTLRGLAHLDEIKHTAVTHGKYMPEALNSACLDWLFGDAVNDLPQLEIKSVTSHDVDEIRAMTRAFDGLDRSFGGEHCRMLAVRYLQDRAIPMLRAPKPARIEREMFDVAAILCELIGWMAYDTSRHSLAQRYFTQALRLAEAAGNRAYAAYVIASMADQALYLARPGQALRLAQVAGNISNRVGVPVVTTEALMLEARAHAVQGDAQACRAALERAERSFHRGRPEIAPEWASHWDDKLFASHVGTCWLELGELNAARTFMGTAWDREEKQGRRYVYAASQLAHVALLQGEIEEAASLATTAVQSARGLTSHRSKSHLTALRKQLLPHAQVAYVREFEQKTQALEGRRSSLLQ
ncbi:hypothetical protein [Micromonospora inyonensis]|uniref:hypothetical protein n=1 Tax=Micromonospora inyonensis TaxID=47866 RepID=UPI00114CF960|nr:hypothetical protein [Micromonospora inyonensis]